MLYDYSRLISRIEEVFESQEAFGMAMDWSHDTTKKKLNNESKWAIGEIHKATELLNIPATDCASCFFTLKGVEAKKNIIDTNHGGHEAAKLFNCLSTELQDEFIALMRQMVAQNKEKTA